MKEEQHPLHHHNKRPGPGLVLKFFNSPATYVLLLILAYVLGYLSAPTARSPPPVLADISHVTPKPATTVAQQADMLPNQLDNFRVTTHCADPIPPELVRQTIIDRVFNSTSPYVDFPPAHAKPLLRGKMVRGWGSYGAVFKHLIEEVKPRVIIEVGTFLGASALHMAELTRQLGLNTQILCVDDFRGWPGFRDKFKKIKMVNGDVLLLYQFMKNVELSNATGSVIPVPFSSGWAFEKLCEWGVVGDLIEIDAGHDFNSAWADINRAYRVLRPGGVMFGHDYFTGADNRGVRRAVNLFAQINGLKIQTHGQHWVIHFS